MPDIEFTRLTTGSKTAFLKADADASPYDPEALTRWAFTWKDKSRADSLRAADVVYEVLQQAGIEPVPGSGYPMGAWSKALQLATAMVRCTSFTKNDQVTDKPTTDRLLSLPEDVLDRYADAVQSEAIVTKDDLDAVKKKPGTDIGD